MVSNGIITSTISAWAFPVLVVTRKHGKPESALTTVRLLEKWNRVSFHFSTPRRFKEHEQVLQFHNNGRILHILANDSCWRLQIHEWIYSFTNAILFGSSSCYLGWWTLCLISNDEYNRFWTIPNLADLRVLHLYILKRAIKLRWTSVKLSKLLLSAGLCFFNLSYCKYACNNVQLLAQVSEKESKLTVTR